MNSLLADLRFGCRMLGRNPGFATVAVLTLGLGIGANAAMFSVLNAVVLRSLPYAEPDRLFVVDGQREGDGRALSVSLLDIEDWGKEVKGVSGVAASGYWTFNLSGRALPERILGARVSGNFFEVLQSQAQVGRVLTPADDSAQAPPVAVLGYGLWQRVFGGDPDVLGRTVILNGLSHTVVGVMPPGFGYPSLEQEMWAPLANELSGVQRDARFMQALARLAPGADVRSAQASLDTVCARLAAAYPETNRGWSARLVSAHESLVGPVRPALLVLSGAVGIVFLIAWANVANLLLARASAREREVAVRTALGASRWRLARQFMTENLVLGAAGGALGLVLGHAGVAVLRRLSPGNIPRLEEAGLDAAVVAFALGASVLAGLLLGLVPIVRAARTAPRASLQEGERTAGARSRLRTSLVVVQMALAMTLLVGGGLLVQTLRNLLAVPPGFDTERLLSLNLLLTPPRYRELAPQFGFVRQSIAALESVPGVVSAATISQLPLSEGPVRLKIGVEGRPFDRAEAPSVAYRAISPTFFRTMGIRLHAGRATAETDSETAPPVVVVNQAMARRLWPGEDPLGRRIRFVNDPDVNGVPRWHEVVGLVGDVKSRGLDADEEPVAYVAFAQRRVPFVRGLSIVVRTAADPMALLPTVRRALLAVDAEQPVFGVRTLDEVVARSVAGRRFQAVLLQSFAGLALLLAVIGVYGVLSDAVGRRTREIGVRMALGAQPRQVLRLVLGEGMALALGGLALGLPASLALARTLKSFLFGVAPGDPLTLVALSLLLAASALAAAYIPARRATRVDPMAALRAE
jgi:putative ABC transport system permease protein